MGIIKDLLSNGLVQARIQKGLRAASMFGGAWTLSHLYDWMTAHITYFSQADSMAIAGTISAAAAGLILTVGSAVLSQFDASKVSAKITIAAATGSVEAANDKATIKEVKAAAGSPGALAQVVATLQAGKE